MATQSEQAPATSGKRGGRALALGLGAGLLLGGAGFGAIYLGLLDGMIEANSPAGATVAPLDAIGFLPLEPIIVNLPPDASARHLRFVGQLEVVPDHAEEVALLMPRILDALNTYLRAVDIADLEQPAATVRLRAQMLRRIQVVTGVGRVQDLLITEFVLS